MKVAVLDAAGGIGQALSLLLKLRMPAGSELALYDVAPVTPGVAVDLSHIPTDVSVTGFCGDDACPALARANVVLISAGIARKRVWTAPTCSISMQASSAGWLNRRRRRARWPALALLLTRSIPPSLSPLGCFKKRAYTIKTGCLASLRWM